MNWLRIIVVSQTLLAAVACPCAKADGDAIALINGRPITRQQVVDLVMQAHGYAALQQLVALELARQESGRRGLAVTEADIQLEFDRAVKKISPQRDAAGVDLNADEKQRALTMLLEQRNISMAEFRVGMERNAHLRKVAEADFRVDDKTLREEFARTLGEKAEVRHVQVAASDAATLQKAVDALANQVDFATVVQRYSQNPDAAGGGLMAPFSFKDESLPAALREAAFALQAGEVSPPIRTGNMVHILRLERRISPADVRFEDVREQVLAGMRERVTDELRGKLLTELLDKADVRVLDADLKKKYEEMKKQNAAANAAGK
ncbi:Foldase protein PrsA precursor [Phycisphaerae bacterium RAS1]|nr:Foldase protein PrsA precursor [Phycisphaerae bacterium RAS1]